MATRIKTWEIIGGKLEPSSSTLADNQRTEAYDLETWIAENSEIVGNDIAIIGRQVITKSGPLDLIGIDRAGNIVIIELKRDLIPRMALAQAIDYASDVSDWSLDEISEICIGYTEKNLEDFLGEKFEDVTLESMAINQDQKILIVGFDVEEALERMVSWLSEKFSLNINVIILNYVKTNSGSELLNKTTIIPEELANERTSRKKFTIPMSNEPGNYEVDKLKILLSQYFEQNLKSAKRIRNILIPECLKKDTVTREELKKAFIKYNEPNADKNAGNFMSLISNQIGMKKNDFLRQIISYETPNYAWEKDNYQIRPDYRELIKEIIETPSA